MPALRVLEIPIFLFVLLGLKLPEVAPAQGPDNIDRFQVTDKKVTDRKETPTGIVEIYKLIQGPNEGIAKECHIVRWEIKLSHGRCVEEVLLVGRGLRAYRQEVK